MFSWTVSKAGGPKRHRHASVAVGNKLYSFGGREDEWTDDMMKQMDVHVFTTVSLSWKKLPPEEPGRGERHLQVPSMCSGHTAVLIEGTVYIWGGYPYCSVLYAYDVDDHRWFKPRVSGTVPLERCNHSACVLKKDMFIHGGINEHTQPTNDMYKLDTSTMIWTLIDTRGTPLPVSSRHTATIIGTKMFVFGGWDDYLETDTEATVHNIRVFDTNSWMNTPSAELLPGGRLGHSAFTYNGELYIFGGSNGEQYLNDVWKFNPKTFSWKKVEPKGKGPGPLYFMCCCIVGGQIILFGGLKRDFDPPSNELFILDMSPSLKTLCKLAAIQYALDQSELPHDIRWELAAMTKNSIETSSPVML